MTRTVIRANGLALYCVPKCANSAIRRAVLAGLGYGREAQQDHHHPALRLARPGPHDGFRVAFLRHPLDRLVSCWADKIARRKPGGTAGLERAGFWVGMTFPEFVQAVAERRDRDPHTRRQQAFLAERMDLIGTVERIDAGWSRLRAMAPWLPALERCNASPRRPDWCGYYDPGLRLLAERLYDQDLAAWRHAYAAEREAIRA